MRSVSADGGSPAAITTAAGVSTASASGVGTGAAAEVVVVANTSAPEDDRVLTTPPGSEIKQEAIGQKHERDTGGDQQDHRPQL